jgi:hypothetical protein
MLYQLSNLMPVIINIVLVLLLVLLFCLILHLARKLYGFIRLYTSERVALVVTPPAFDDKVSLATESLFTSTHTLGTSRTLLERILGREFIFTAEIRSTKQTGIQFLMTIDKTKAKALEKLIAAYVPDAKVRREPITQIKSGTKILSYRQAKNYVYPLKPYEFLDTHDPLGYITAAMTKLEDDEQITLLIIYKPVKVKSADRIRLKILKNDAFLPESQNKKNVLNPIFSSINAVLFWFTDAATMTYHQQARSQYNASSAQKDLLYKEQLARGDRPVRTLSYFEHEIIETVSEKLKRPLFKADIRVLVKAKRSNASEYKGGIQSALSLFEVPSYQSLKQVRRPYVKLPQSATPCLDSRC